MFNEEEEILKALKNKKENLKKILKMTEKWKKQKDKKISEKYMKDVMQIVTHAVEQQNYQIEEEGVWLIAELTFYFPDKRRRDCHNMHKLIMDSLECVAFVDDRWVLVL